MEKESQESARPTALPTIWVIPDALWTKFEGILQDCDPPKRTGRKRVDRRAVLNAILYRLRTGCQWNPSRLNGLTTARSIGPSSGGLGEESSAAFGPS